MAVEFVKRYDRTTVGTIGTSKVKHGLTGGASYYLSAGRGLSCGRTADGIESYQSGRVITVTCGGCRRGM